MTPLEKDLREKLELKAPGGEINYSVVAGAGAGKSTMLSKRIAGQIKNGAELDSFVIITYTNAAANELRDKLADELSELLKDARLSASEKDNVSNALSKIELIQISTIHSFLLQVLREYAFESKLTLDAKMYEDEDEKERRTAFFNKWYYDHFSEIDAFRADWTIENEKHFKTDHTRDVLWNMFNDIASLREEVIVDTLDHSADFEAFAKSYVDKNLPMFVTFKNAVMANAPLKKDGSPKLIKAVQTLVDDVATVEGNVLSGSYGIDDAKMLTDAYKNVKDRIKAKEKDSAQGFYGKDTFDMPLDGLYPVFPKDELEWNFTKYYEDYMLWAQKSAKLAEYVLDMREAFQKETDSETRIISNDDILFRAEKLLEEHPDILDDLREKYSYIYVDEFQDTTLTQAKIVELLSGKKGSALGSFDPKENTLLVVGDPKQSIYRFTGAEKAVYDKVNADIMALPKSLAESVMLDANFRSNSLIVDWVNDKYTKLMPSYSPMNTDWNVKEKECLSGVFTYDFTDPNGTGKYTKEEDAASVTDLIKTLTGNEKYFIEEYNRKTGDYLLRKIKYSDFMVITKNATDMLSFVEEFAKAGIPLNVQGKFKVGGDEVIRNFIRILSFFAKSKNEKALAIASQIAGGVNAAKDEESALRTSEDKLIKLKEEFDKEGLDSSAIVHRLLKKEELYLPSGTFDVLRVKEYKTRLNQMTESCLRANEGDLLGLISEMESYLAKDIRKENPLESGEDAVRLMNVHQAKGLTGNIVIIANRKNDEAPRYSGFKSMGKYYPAASYSNGEGLGVIIKPSYACDDNLMKRAGAEEWDESMRLEYVAATRAAHALIFMPLVCDGRGTVNNNIWFTNDEYKIDSLPTVNDWLARRNSDTTVYPVSSVAISAHIHKKLTDLENAIAACDMDKVTAKTCISITPSSLEPLGLTGYSDKDPGYVPETDRPKGNVFGTVMHRTYELIFSRYNALKGLDNAKRNKAISRIINQAISEQLSEMHADDNPAEFASYLEGKMSDYFDKVIVPIMDDAEEIYPEYSFSFFVPIGELKDFKTRFELTLLASASKLEIKSDNIWVNGQADLVVKRKDGTLKVYDYKSDGRNGKDLSLFEASLDFKYKGQLDLYKYAIGKAFGVADIATEIIHLYR